MHDVQPEAHTGVNKLKSTQTITGFFSSRPSDGSAGQLCLQQERAKDAYFPSKTTRLGRCATADVRVGVASPP